MAKNILKTKAPITPQRIICFLFFGTKFEAIEPTITALSAVNINVIKIILVKIISSSIKITYIIKKYNTFQSFVLDSVNILKLFYPLSNYLVDHILYNCNFLRFLTAQ